MSIKKNIEDVTIKFPTSIKKILEKININGLGIIFVVNEKDILIGSVTDGDIRRALLKNFKLEDKLNLDSKVINKNPIFLPNKSNIREIWKYLEQEITYGTEEKIIKCIPLLDEQGKITDIATKQSVRKISIFEPNLGEQELSNVIESVKSGWISSQGKYVIQFEKLFGEFLNENYSLAVSSGTTALQLAIKAFGIGPGDEIILTNFTFAACINSILNSGAKPVLVDVDKETWTMSIEQVKNSITSKTKAILAVHVYGQPCRMDELVEITKKNKIILIEDCAEAIGSKYKNKLVGTFGDCSTFSFFANKTISTGEGGMVVFKDEKIFKKAIILRDHGMSKTKKYWHEEIGYNFRMTNMQAAIGVAQIKRINLILNHRKKLFDHYNNKLDNIKKISLLPKNNWSENAFWLYTIIIDNLGEKKRNKLIDKLRDRGIECRPGFYPLHQMRPYKTFGKNSYKISELMSYNSLSLPSSSNLKINDLDHIVDVLREELVLLKLI